MRRQIEDAQGLDTIGGDKPFMMQADARGWIFVPSGVANGTAAANAITSTAATTTANGDLIFGAATEDSVQVWAGSIAATQTFGRADRYLAQMAAFKHR